MSRALHTLIALLGCLHLCGGHFGVLQVIAWSSMLVEYTSQDGIIAGTVSTFDGQHPCDLCRAIEEGKRQEKEDPRRPTSRDRDLELKPTPIPHPTDLPKPGSAALIVSHRPPEFSPPLSWASSPPTPPPRPVV